MSAVELARPTPRFDDQASPSECAAPRIEIPWLDVFYGRDQALRIAEPLEILDRDVTAIIGPSGCGKSTLIRCINRMHELIPGAWARGEVLLEGQNVYDKSVDPVALRRVVGMVFQRANPFPTMSIFDNVVAGLKLGGNSSQRHLDQIAEESLRRAALWDEVKDIRHRPGTHLSGGQQQRLCIARALAVQPRVLLMDEPCANLDPKATASIEELIRTLREDITIVIVTHNMQQAARVSERTVFMLAGDDGIGEIVEVGETRQIFTNPKDRRTEDYITLRFSSPNPSLPIMSETRELQKIL